MEKNPLGKDLMIVALVKLARLGEEDFADIQQPRQVGPVIHEVPDKDEGIQVEIREAGKRVVCRLNGKAREISARLAIVGIQRQLHEWWNDTANTKEQHEGATRRGGKVTGQCTFSVKTSIKEAVAWAEKESEDERRRCVGGSSSNLWVLGWKLQGGCGVCG